MFVRATRAELFLFGLAVLVLSGAPSALYVKSFALEPPFPDVFLKAPVLLLMFANMLVRLRSTFFGAWSVLPWLALAVLGAASTLWSVSAADSFREGVVALIAVLYLGMIAGIADWEDLLVVIWRVCIGLILLSGFLFVFVPSLGKMSEIYPGALSGPWFEKNATGQFFLFAGLVNLALLALRPRRAMSAAVWALVCAGMLVLTESTTALIAFVAGAAVFAGVAVMRRNVLISIPAALLLVFIGGPAIVMILSDSTAILESLGKSGTLTGRTPIWEALVDFSLNDRPWLGHGYAAFWTSEYEFSSRAYIYDEIKYRAPHSHNAVLEARLDLGWAGAVLFALAGLQLWLTSLWRTRASAGTYFALPLCAALTLVSLVEVSPLSVANLAGCLFVLTLAKMTLAPSLTDRQSGLWRQIRRMERPQPMTFAPA